MTDCKVCNDKGWYWKQPEENLNFLPTGNFGLLGNEIQAPCPWCKRDGINSFFNKNKKIISSRSVDDRIDMLKK